MLVFLFGIWQLIGFTRRHHPHRLDTAGHCKTANTIGGESNQRSNKEKTKNTSVFLYFGAPASRCPLVFPSRSEAGWGMNRPSRYWDCWVQIQHSNGRGISSGIVLVLAAGENSSRAEGSGKGIDEQDFRCKLFSVSPSCSFILSCIIVSPPLQVDGPSLTPDLQNHPVAKR